MSKTQILVTLLLLAFALLLGYLLVPVLINSYKEGAQEMYLFFLIWPVTIALSYLIKKYYLSGNTIFKIDIYILTIVLSSFGFLFFQYLDQKFIS